MFNFKIITRTLGFLLIGEGLLMTFALLVSLLYKEGDTIHFVNSAVITIVEDDKVDELLKAVHKLDNRNKEIGVRAFVWNIEKTV